MFPIIMYKRRVICIIAFLWLKISDSRVVSYQNHTVIKNWKLEDLPLLPLIFAKSAYLPDGPCKEDARRFLHGLHNGAEWAVQMFDSSTKYPDGILYGHTRHLGNFDECYNLYADIPEENNAIREINGRYCLVDIEYRKKHTIIHKRRRQPEDQQVHSIWKRVEEREDFIRVRRYYLQQALCVPSSCNAKDVETALNGSLEEYKIMSNIELRIAVQPALCQTIKEAPKFTLGAGIYCAVILALLSLVIISTWYKNELSKSGNRTSRVRDLMLHFEERKNYQNIFDMDRGGIQCLHIIRFILCISALFFHICLKFIYIPVVNAVYFENIYFLPFSTIITNGTLMIDAFFALSGILAAFQSLKDLDRYKRLHFVKNIVSRYVRLTPSYAVIICFYIWIFPLLGSGPFWKDLVEQECTYCAKNWWKHLFYLNNYVAPTELSPAHGWYLAADFQLFFCCQFVLYAFWSMPRKIGYFFLGMLTIISCCMSFIATYAYDAFPVLRLSPYVFKITDVPYLSMYYVKTYMHAAGYLIGIIAGAIIHDYKHSKLRLSKFWSHVLVFPLPLTLYIAFQYWAQKFFIPFNSWSILEAALHAFCARIMSPLLICSLIVLLSVSTHLESYYHYLTPRWAYPAANLSYQIYLVHFVILHYEIGQAKTANTFGFFEVIRDAVSLLIFSVLVSLFLVISVELPCRKIIKEYFFKEMVAKERSVDNNTNKIK